MATANEVLAAIHPRNDDSVCLYNLKTEAFPDREFSIGALLADLPWEDWMSLINSEKAGLLASSAAGDWSQYVKAAVLRLQKKYSTLRLRGMDMIIHGSIPVAAGLSSSSALVVATAEAMVVVNNLDTFPAQLVDLCGEGEWFVGTRGGSADHAAIKFGQKGKVAKVKFFDFALEKSVEFPKDYVLLICNSGIRAQKTTNAKEQFNQRVACYYIGLQLIKKYFPQYAALLCHLRDVNSRNLMVPLSWIYKILLRLPESITGDELVRLFTPEQMQAIARIHQISGESSFPIRGVVLYGLAECERSRLFSGYLEKGLIAEVGTLMNASHNGDRVVSFSSSGEESSYVAPVSNAYLLDLMDDLESGDPDRVLRAQLQWQPGSYRCSVPEIDRMVDISIACEGVAGAQLAGAGLGGCMMVLVKKGSREQLKAALIEKYYQPFKMPPVIISCQPVTGSGVLFVE
jgi:N-acetylgalactosamine kinase